MGAALTQRGVLQSSRAPPLASSILSFQVAAPTNSAGQAQAKSLEPEAKEKSVILRLSLLEILIFCSLWIFAFIFFNFALNLTYWVFLVPP